MKNSKLVKKAHKIYREISPKFKDFSKTKKIVIDPITKEFYTGNSDIEAYEKACSKHPKRKFYLTSSEHMFTKL